MAYLPCRTLSLSTDHRRVSQRISISLALILTLLPFWARQAHATTAWPFADLQAELNTTYASVQQVLAPLPTIPMTNHFVVPLFWADGSIGTSLIGTNAQGVPDGHLISFNVQRSTHFLQAMQRAGFTSIMITIGWPMLDPGGNYPGVQYYQAFYQQVVQQAKAMGFWVALSSGICPTGIIDYSHYRSIDDVFAGRRRQAWWIAANLQPDWVIVGAEPTTDKLLLRAIPDFQRLDATYWGKHFKSLMAGKPSGTPTKYAGGASPHDPQAFYDAVVATAVDGIDSHPFPLTVKGLPPANQFWQTMLNRFDQGRAARKVLLVTQTSPYKERAEETAAQKLTYNDIYLRDMWDGFQPQDQAFMLMWQQIARKKGVTGVVYWWANRTFMGGYIPYNPLLTYTDASKIVDRASYINLQDPRYRLNAEGQLWASLGGTP